MQHHKVERQNDFKAPRVLSLANLAITWEIFEQVLFLFDCWLFELYENKTCSKISPNTVLSDKVKVKSACSAIATNTHNILINAHHIMIYGVDLSTYLG